MPSPGQEREALLTACAESGERGTFASPSDHAWHDYGFEAGWSARAALAAREEPEQPVSESCALTCYRDTDGVIAHSPECPGVHLHPAKPSPQDVLWRTVVERDELREALALAREDIERLTPEQFYERAAWPVGKLVADVRDPSRIGTVVKRGGQQWASRDKLPMVRWHGKIDAEAVEWERLTRKIHSQASDDADFAAWCSEIPAAGEDTERPSEQLTRTELECLNADLGSPCDGLHPPHPGSVSVGIRESYREKLFGARDTERPAEGEYDEQERVEAEAQAREP